MTPAGHRGKVETPQPERRGGSTSSPRKASACSGKERSIDPKKFYENRLTINRVSIESVNNRDSKHTEKERNSDDKKFLPQILDSNKLTGKHAFFFKKPYNT